MPLTTRIHGLHDTDAETHGTFLAPASGQPPVDH